jgi:hypothetical protein
MMWPFRRKACALRRAALIAYRYARPWCRPFDAIVCGARMLPSDDGAWLIRLREDTLFSPYVHHVTVSLRGEIIGHDSWQFGSAPEWRARAVAKVGA